jgi:peptidoglycan hydrolase FlgJ
MDPRVSPLPTVLSQGSQAVLAPKGAEKSVNPLAAAKARSAAEEFESLFLSQMLEIMFSQISTEPPFGGGKGEEVFRSMLVGEYANGLSQKGGIGISDAVYREILSLQETQ